MKPHHMPKRVTPKLIKEQSLIFPSPGASVRGEGIQRNTIRIVKTLSLTGLFERRGDRIVERQDCFDSVLGLTK